MPSANKRIETALVKAVIELLILRGCVAVRFNNQPTMQLSRGPEGVQFHGYRKLNNRRGISDVCGVAPNGRAIWIECKTFEGRLSTEQREFLQDVHDNGAIAMVARSIGEVEDMLQRQARARWTLLEPLVW